MKAYRENGVTALQALQEPTCSELENVASSAGRGQFEMQLKPTIRKLAADSVPYGDAISTRGHYVWGAFDGDKLVAIGATVDEAKRKYRRVWAAGMTKRGGQADEGRGGGDANLYSESP